ncbi:hypothetical protein ACCAA_670062 [Candidatus Accumulibacter aalborgensis]|uniref:Uncharacterized protein n=1 Tax=Candidatus Accumulibacter aalborgensis TaxID=1860102 RepID=A0A1A8XVU6_9PROT|nr:hypothetical protein ACCAA_670062 [Candidatus Accumulibacter aalborgensis]
MKGRASTSLAGPALPWKPVAGEWVLVRSDAMVSTSPVDVYLIVEAPSLYVHGFESVAGESKGAWPRRRKVTTAKRCAG